jgi:hypothetical protein
MSELVALLLVIEPCFLARRPVAEQLIVEIIADAAVCHFHVVGLAVHIKKGFLMWTATRRIKLFHVLGASCGPQGLVNAKKHEKLHVFWTSCVHKDWPQEEEEEEEERGGDTQGISQWLF